MLPIVMRANGACEASNVATLFGEGKSYFTIEIIEETPITNAMYLLSKKLKQALLHVAISGFLSYYR